MPPIPSESLYQPLFFLPHISSAAADIAEQLAIANGYGDIVTILRGKIEEVEIPEKVDVIISEPIGFLLVRFLLTKCIYTIFFSMDFY